MAWEEESIEGGAEFEEVGGKKSPIKLILIIVGVIAVLAGGFFAYKKFFAADPEEEPTEENGEKPEEPEVPPDTPGFKVNLAKFTLNLAGKGDPHYLVCTIALEVDNEELKNDILDPDDKKLYMIKTRDTILGILRSKTFTEMNDPATAREVTKEIRFKLDRIYNNGKVRNVYFSEFVVQ